MLRTLTAVAGFCRAAFTAPVNFANDGPPNPVKDKGGDGDPGQQQNSPVPASTGDTFDFQKMLLQLLGLPDNADPAAIQQAFNSCMATEPQATAAPGAADQQPPAAGGGDAGADGAAAAAHAAVAKLAEAHKATATAQGQAQQFKGQAQKTQAANEILVKRCELAEGAFANERNEHIATMCNMAVVSGRMTKAEADVRKAKLAGAKNPQEFVTMVNEISALPVKIATSSITNELERTIAPTTASGKFLTMVNEAVAADPKHDFDFHWKKCGQTEAGKSLLDSMRKPQVSPAFVQKP